MKISRSLSYSILILLQLCRVVVSVSCLFSFANLEDGSSWRRGWRNMSNISHQCQVHKMGVARGLNLPLVKTYTDQLHLLFIQTCNIRPQMTREKPIMALISWNVLSFLRRFSGRFWFTFITWLESNFYTGGRAVDDLSHS